MPPDAAGGILFVRGLTVGQFRVTTIVVVVVVNIYTYNNYYFSGHSQVTLGFTCIAPLFQLPECGGSPQAVPAGEKLLDQPDTRVRHNLAVELYEGAVMACGGGWAPRQQRGQAGLGQASPSQPWKGMVGHRSDLWNLFLDASCLDGLPQSQPTASSNPGRHVSRVMVFRPSPVDLASSPLGQPG